MTTPRHLSGAPHSPSQRQSSFNSHAVVASVVILFTREQQILCGKRRGVGAGGCGKMMALWEEGTRETTKDSHVQLTHTTHHSLHTHRSHAPHTHVTYTHYSHTTYVQLTHTKLAQVGYLLNTHSTHTTYTTPPLLHTTRTQLTHGLFGWAYGSHTQS